MLGWIVWVGSGAWLRATGMGKGETVILYAWLATKAIPHFRSGIWLVNSLIRLLKNKKDTCASMFTKPDIKLMIEK